MKKKIYIPTIALIVGEISMFYYITTGLIIHMINLLVIVFILIFSNLSLSLKEKNVLQSLTLLIMLRMINVSIPPLFNSGLLQYSLVYVIMFVPIYSIIKNQDIHINELGINFSKLYIYIPIAIIIGIIISSTKYNIIDPISLINKIRFSDIVLMSIVMVIFIGAIEEFIFRSILQTRLEKILGLRYGLLLTGGIFGIMHTGNGILNEVLFASVFGIILGYIFQKTRSLFSTISIHGTANLMSFGMKPNGLMSIIANVQNLSSIYGGYVIIFLIIVLSISFLISDTKYWNKYISNVLNTYSSPLLLIFALIVIYKVIHIIT